MRRLRDLQLTIKFPLLVSACSLLFVAFGVVAFGTASEAKIGGERYKQIETANGLVADILPPPLYLVEANMQALGMLGPARDGLDDQLQAMRTRLEELRAEYQTRHDYWDERSVVPSVDEMLHGTVDDTAKAYFGIIDRQFLPAIDRNDIDTAERVAYGTLQLAFKSHREAVDELVAAAREHTDTIKNDAISFVNGRMTMLAVVMGLVVALSVLASVLIGRAVAKPVRRVRDVLTRVAEGDLTGRVRADGRDEVGQMATALDASLESLASSFGHLARVAGDLDHSALELQLAATGMNTSAEMAATEAAHVAETASTVTENVHAVAIGSGQMTTAIEEIARGANEATTVVAEAVQLAEGATDTVTRLGHSSTEIGNVVAVINSIAEQTNMLALNATIEAARAGEVGRGFAVVAGEVQALARQTAEATDQISRRIHEVQRSAGDAVSAIERISEIIERINHSQTSIAAAVEEQSLTTRFMDESAGSAAGGVAEIADRIAGVAVAAGEVSAGGSQTRAAATSLAAMSNQLRDTLAGYRFTPANTDTPDAPAVAPGDGTSIRAKGSAELSLPERPNAPEPAQPIHAQSIHSA